MDLNWNTSLLYTFPAYNLIKSTEIRLFENWNLTKRQVKIITDYSVIYVW